MNDDDALTMTHLTYAYANDAIVSVSPAFTGSDPDGSYINTVITITQADLPTGKTFDDMTQADYETIGRAKLNKMTANN